METEVTTVEPLNNGYYDDNVNTLMLLHIIHVRSLCFFVQGMVVVWTSNCNGCLYSTEWNGGMERWNGTVEWNGME